MRLRATHEEIIAHPVKVGMRFTAMFIPVFFVIMWLQGNAFSFTFKSLGGIVGMAAFLTITFGYGLKLMHGWSDKNAR
jgi:hypothetical protein